MTSREAFQRIMKYEPADRFPLMVIDPYESVTVDRWHKEGVPQGVSPARFLQMDVPPDFGIDLQPSPAFERRIISENEKEFIEVNYLGATVRRAKEAPNMFYGYIDHPVKSMADWREYKKRMNARTPGRLTGGVEEIINAVNSASVPVGLHLYPWFFRLGFFLLGMERFLTAFYDDPEMMHDLFAHHSQFVLEVIRPLLGRAKFDYACFVEDLAYRNGPHISPEIYREFWLRHQDPLARELEKAGIPIISMYTSGNCEVLLPLMMEHGINCTWPCERNAAMDPLNLRKKFGKDLRLVGGVGHTSLAKNPAAVDAEIERLTPLMKEGGFIPMVDDMVPPEVPFANYRHCIETLRKLRPQKGGPAHA
jgi:uroporphyrinogen decarboxylase